MSIAATTSPISDETPSNVVSLPVAHSAERASSEDVISHLRKSQLFRDYEEAFQATTGLPLVLRRAGALHSTLLATKQISPLCAVMAARNKSCAACLRLQQEVEDQAATTDNCTLECVAGLSESAVPIRVGREVIGFLQTGQVMMQKPTAAGFKKIARQVSELGADIDMAALEVAYHRTRVVPKAQYEAVLRLLRIFGEHLSGLSTQVATWQSMVESPVIARARAYIAEHLEDELSMADVAKAMNMSTFYFCKMFKKSVGINFVDYVSRIRVENVKRMLLNPHCRVSEAAFAAGFQSLSQFNRSFRRVAGESPSDYREKLHAVRFTTTARAA